MAKKTFEQECAEGRWEFDPNRSFEERCEIIAGCKYKTQKGVGICAAIALGMMFMGPIGMAAFPPELFGIFERFSTCSAVGYNAILGIYLFNSFK